jgi:hypothetical protein
MTEELSAGALGTSPSAQQTATADEHGQFGRGERQEDYWIRQYTQTRQAELALLAKIMAHNDACEAQCAAQDKTRCEAYTGRGRECPDCPRDSMIEL